jgi:tetratricopeptide (TPR) repeat protein
MRNPAVYLKPAVAAFLLWLTPGHPGLAQTQPQNPPENHTQEPSATAPDSAADNTIATLLERLRTAPAGEAATLARTIELKWSASGSPTADLLLKRGQDALEASQLQRAIEHFTALTDHAPAFAEGWHGRAQAFFASGAYGLALSDLRTALALNPQHFGAIYGLAALLEQLEKPQEAHAAYKILLNLYPAHEKALEGVARLSPSVNGVAL